MKDQEAIKRKLERMITCYRRHFITDITMINRSNAEIAFMQNPCLNLRLLHYILVEIPPFASLPQLTTTWRMSFAKKENHVTVHTITIKRLFSL